MCTYFQLRAVSEQQHFWMVRRKLNNLSLGRQITSKPDRKIATQETKVSFKLFSCVHQTQVNVVDNLFR
jgi:hypothetical protein